MSVRSKGNLVLLPPILALIIASVLYFSSQSQEREALFRVEHTLQTQEGLADLEKSLLKAENNLRGYLLTGDPNFLYVYRDMAEASESRVWVLGQLIQDPVQARRIPELQALVAARLGLMARQAERPESPELENLVEEGRRAMGAVSTLINVMQRDETRLMAERMQLLERARTVMHATNAAGLGLGVGGGIVCMFLFTAYITRRLRFLEDGARNMERGEVMAVPEADGDEIGRLTVLFRRASGKILERERALKESENRLDASQQLSLDAFTILSAVRGEGGRVVDFVWTYVNPVAERILKRPAAELLGQRLLEVLPGNREESELFDRYVRVVETGQPHDIELRYESEGIAGWFRNTAVRLGDGVAITFSDITARKAMEQDLRLAKEEAERTAAELRATMDALPCGLVVFGPEADIRQINDEALRIFGYTPGQTALPIRERMRILSIERPGGGVIPLDELPGMRTLRGEQIGNEIMTFGNRLAQSKTWAAVNGAPIRGAGGRIVGSVLSLADVSAMMALQDQLAAAKVAAEEASRAKSAFLATMSHEIRTPMNGIMGMTDLALMTDVAPRTREYLRMARQSAAHLLAIINDILDLSKIEAGRLELERRRFDLRQAVDAVCGPLSLAAGQRGVGFTCAFAPDLPACLIGDQGRLKQILTNIVGNAVKFTRRGEVAVDVRRDERAPAAEGAVRLIFRVRDTGIGIPADKLDTIFESFAQADLSAHAEFGGTGLGLSISRQLVEMMGGRIRVQSREGAGSTFFFSVELGLCGEAQTLGETFRSVGAGAMPSLRILLAEDNKVNQILATEMLRQQGHRVTLAVNGREALEALAREDFDLVLLDVQMPEMDGEEVASRVRRGETRDACVPIVALTAHALAGDRERFIAAGMDDYLAKPFELAALRQVILRALSGSRRG
jgi:signal transduction histidine kinase/CheY-like chemotaxis protein